MHILPRIRYTLFERPVENSDKNLNVAGAKKTAWALMEQGKLDEENKKKNKKPLIEGGQGTGKVDTKRLEYFSDVDSLHYLLKHPVLNSFLELELNSLKIRYIFDFFFYLSFVVLLFIFLTSRWKTFFVFLVLSSNIIFITYHRYGLSKGLSFGEKNNGYIYYNEDLEWRLSIPLIILLTILTLLIIREFWQMFIYRKRYFYITENYLEWIIIALTIVNILPSEYDLRLAY